VFAAPIHVDIERQDTPKYLVARPDSIVLLAIGDTMPINVLGVYPTGGALPFSHSTRTTYTSNNTQIVTVDSQGIVTAVAVGETTVLIRYGSLSTTIDVSIEPRPTGTPPQISGVDPPTGVPGQRK
jgi:hypothetical protein